MPDKMIDLGRMDEFDTVVTSKQSKRKKSYPTVWTRETTLPLTAADVGKTFKISGTIHVTGLEERVEEGRKGTGKEYNFELRSIQIHNPRGKLKKALKKNMR